MGTPVGTEASVEAGTEAVAEAGAEASTKRSLGKCSFRLENAFGSWLECGLLGKPWAPARPRRAQAFPRRNM